MADGRALLESVIAEVAKRASPSSGDNLRGFAIDAQHYLTESGVLSEATVRHTNDPRCLLAIRAQVTYAAATLQEVAGALRAAWGNMAYGEFQASSCVWYREATVLKFVTAMHGRDLFVCGRVVAAGGPYERLVEQFLRDFGSLNGPLPPLPNEDQE